MNWAERLRMIMREQGVTQIHLAQMIGMTQQHLSRMMQKDVKLSTLLKIADALGVTAADILSEESAEGRQESSVAQKQASVNEEHRRTHVHGYLRIGDRIVEINSMQELRDAVTACEVNYLQ